MKTFLRGLAFVGQTYCVVHLVREYFVEFTLCYGPSMLPTFNVSGDVVVVDRFSPRIWGFKVGDVVVSKSPTEPENLICKRIIGLPGDRVSSDPTNPSAEVLQILDFVDLAPLKVPRGRVWLQGDNLSNSLDSRSYGPVPQALVEGKVVFKIFPWREIGIVRNNIK